MILRDTQNRTQEGNLQGETITMGISDIRLIIDRLTDLYQDRELACIREYTTNATDAHIEAGVTTPVEVSTPTHLSPFLTIKDFGIGLSLEDIRVIYSQYGASTKRNTNDQTGALGLGCKSALSYTDQFTVTSVKDGVRIQVVVSRDPMKGATMQVVDTADTDEPNGTTVIIPARAHNDFERKANKFFRFWKPGTVKLNGREPELLPGARWVEDGKLALIQEHQSYIVMGGVPYPTHLHHGLSYGQGVVAFVPIGAVDFAPSREGLMDTDATKATQLRVVADLKTKLAASIKADIEGAKTAREAVQARIDWRQRVPQSYMPTTAAFKGKTIPSSIQTPPDTIQAPRNARKMTGHHALPNGISIEQVYNVVWVTGHDHASFTATTKKKLEKYVDDNGLEGISSYLLSPTTVTDKTWLEDVHFVKWDTIKALKLPKNSPAYTPSGRIPGSYDIYEDGDFNEGVPGDDIDTSNPVFWMFGAYHEGRSYAMYLKAKHPGCTLVMLRRGREDKFQRLFPKSERAETVISADFKKWAASVSKDDAVAWACQNDYRLADLDALDPTKVDDPQIKHALSVRKRDLSALQTEINEWHKVGMYYSNDESSIGNPLEKYPLMPEGYTLRQMRRANSGMDHVYRYLNTEFLYQTQQAAAKSAGNS